jgi:hypothetical protein
LLCIAAERKRQFYKARTALRKRRGHKEIAGNAPAIRKIFSFRRQEPEIGEGREHGYMPGRQPPFGETADTACFRGVIKLLLARRAQEAQTSENDARVGIMVPNYLVDLSHVERPDFQISVETFLNGEKIIFAYQVWQGIGDFRIAFHLRLLELGRALISRTRKQ